MIKPILITVVLISMLLTSCNNNCDDCEEINQEIKIMSFNIRYDNEADGINKWSNRKEACIQMIEQKNPSVFGIQEGQYHQVQYLNENLSNYSYAGIGRDAVNDGEFSAVFYLKDRFELIETNTFWLSETPEIPSIGWDAALKRIATWVHLRDQETQKSFYVFNTHFDHVGNSARNNSASLIVDKVEEIAGGNATTFITGDFNAILTQQSVFSSILSVFDNAQTNAPVTDNKTTFNSWGSSNSTIDFIFYNEAEILTYETIDQDFGVPYISDHYPILSSFKY